MNRRVTLAGWSSSPFSRVKTLPVSAQSALPFLPVLVLLEAVASQGLDRVGVERDGARADVGLGIVLVHLPAVHDELLGDGDETGVQVGVRPLLPARLAPPQAAERDQVKQRVQAVLRGGVEEEAGVLRRPDHHRRRLLAGALPVEDAFLGPRGPSAACRPPTRRGRPD